MANFLCFRAPKLWPQPNGARLRCYVCYDVLWWWIKGGLQDKPSDLKNSSKIETRNNVAIVVTCWMLWPAPIIPIDCNTMTSSPKKPKCWNTLVPVSGWWIEQIGKTTACKSAEVLRTLFFRFHCSHIKVQGLQTCGFGSSGKSETKGGCPTAKNQTASQTLRVRGVNWDMIWHSDIVVSCISWLEWQSPHSDAVTSYLETHYELREHISSMWTPLGCTSGSTHNTSPHWCTQQCLHQENLSWYMMDHFDGQTAWAVWLALLWCQ